MSVKILCKNQGGGIIVAKLDRKDCFVMKQKLLKRVTAVLSALAMGLVLIGSTPLTAKADSLAESVEKMGKNTWYRNLIEEQSRYSNQSDFTFDLVDVDADGVDDLIMTYNLVDMTTGNVKTEAQLWSYNKYITGVGGYTSDASTIYYCSETKYVQCVLEQTYGYTVSFGRLSSPANNYLSYNVDFDGNYVTVDETTGAVTVITDEETIAQYDSWEETYLPSSEEASGRYEKTEENLDTYLPLEIKVETEMIMLKVGEAFGISTENIDKLLEEAGYNYKSNPDSYPKIFYGERVIMDTEYLMPACGVGVHDITTQELLDVLYVADDEWTELLEQEENGVFASKYGTEVILVEEAEGYAYYARAEKNGSTMITIPEYPLASGETITVNIPVFVEAVSQEGGNDSVIESTTDNSIVIDNSNSVLPTGTVLQSAKLESGEEYTDAETIVKTNVTNLGNYAVYDLDLTDGNGTEIHQLNGKVSVTMDIPFTMAENSTLKVYRVDNGTLVNCPATVSNGKVTFETDHFSTYIFAEEKVTVVAPQPTPEATPEQPPITAPQTGDTSTIDNFVLLMVAGISLCGVVVVGKKYNRV